MSKDIIGSAGNSNGLGGAKGYQSKLTWEEELKKAEELLGKSLRHEPNQTSFYEGYIKGLKFASDLRKQDEEELIKIMKASTEWGNILSVIIKDYYSNK